METVLVFGSRPGSLGEAVADQANVRGYDVIVAGLDESCQYQVDGRNTLELENLMRAAAPLHHVVCTVGVNDEDDLFAQRNFEFLAGLDRMWEGNVLVPMQVFKTWSDWWRKEASPGDNHAAPPWQHFVAISSNSASVPRSRSIGYCASKAALSQAVRCAGRYLTSVGADQIVYAYEPGWINGTPMSQSVLARLPAGTEPMRGGATTDRDDLAELIVNNFRFASPRVLNGMTFRMDGGEQ